MSQPDSATFPQRNPSHDVRHAVQRHAPDRAAGSSPRPGLRAWLAALAYLPALAAAVPPAGTTTLVYELSRSGLALAQMTDTLRVEGGAYRLVSDAQGVGLVALIARGQTIRRESRGTIVGHGLQPKNFVEQRGNNYRLAADFDWPAGSVVLTDAKGEVSRESVAAQAQDRLTMPYQLAFARGTPPESFSVQVADGRHVTDYAFRLVGTETVATGLGEVRALHYTKVLSGNDTAFDFWLGLDQYLLPVRVSYADKDGARFEQSLRSYHPARL